jgi:hypothetical protein
MRKVFCTAFILLAALAAQARVISYAPYSDRVSYPALQNRLNRHVVVVEGDSPAFTGGILISPPLPGYGAAVGQVVVYDTKGVEEPRVVFPDANTLTSIFSAAVREDGAGVPTILIQTNFNYQGTNPQFQPIWLLSIDGGTSWKKVALPLSFTNQLVNYSIDIGGPFAHARGSSIRTGTIDTPFVVANAGDTSLYSVSRDGSVKKLYSAPNTGNVQLLGANRDGTRFVVRSGLINLLVVDLQGNSANVGTVDSQSYTSDAWITSDGSVYLSESTYPGQALWLYSAGVKTWISGPAGTNAGNQVPQGPKTFFAVPTANFNGAWIIQRGTGSPTNLLLHTQAGGLKQQWSDITAPEVEALHAGASGTTLLIQVHRPRLAADQRLFKDPALAVWHVGDPLPPSFYDELFMAEQDTKGFVHVDADALESGDMFVFDSGPVQQGGGGVVISPPPPSSGGGSDVVQEWGVVKASLAQRLVIPGVGRTAGAYDSFWLTDVTFRNPSDAPVTVSVRYAPNGDVQTADVKTQTITLKGREIRLVSDVLKTMFNAETGGGALFLTPAVGSSIEASARTYSKSSAGTFGYGMNAIDVFAAASPRFPVSFAGAFPGANFRTNLVLTDVSGRGTEMTLNAAGVSGITGNSGVSFGAVPNGEQQINGIGAWLGLGTSESGALLITPTRGETVAAVFAIDNKTNDPTYFPPDLPAPVVRTIPAIGHLDGANGSRFRSDLYLYNPSKQLRTVTLQCTPWDTTQQPQTITLTLLANEARVIRDVLFAAFAKEGIARIRYQSSGDPGVRVTSRTYTLNPDGGTYGFLMPPLNSFQAAGAGDTLEILGAVGDRQFRTNLGIVDLAAFTNGVTTRFRVEVVSETGATLDSFESTVASASGVQLTDIFAARNIGVTGPVLLRVTPINGMIGTFATLIDNATNDPTYLPANLAAKY